LGYGGGTRPTQVTVHDSWPMQTAATAAVRLPPVPQGPGASATSDSVAPLNTPMHALLRARAPGVVAGLDAALLSLRIVDPSVVVCFFEV
jgi:hypothetical protein